MEKLCCEKRIVVGQQHSLIVRSAKVTAWQAKSVGSFVYSISQDGDSVHRTRYIADKQLKLKTAETMRGHIRHYT